MFIGAINSKIKSLLFTERQIFKDRRICVGCSGNFTVEQILQGMGCQIWSNDIALYSSLIGNYLADKEMRLEIAEGGYHWLEPYVAAGGISRIAAVFLLFEMLKNEKGNHLAAIRLYEHYKKNFASFHATSCVKIKAALDAIQIENYTTMDVYELYRGLGAEWLRVAFLPTYVGGYEKLYARLEQILGWDAPKYEMLTKERYEETIQFMRRGDFLYLADYDRQEDGLFAVVKTGRMKNVYLYSNLPFKKSYIMPVSKSTRSDIHYLPDSYKIGPQSVLSFRKTDNARLNYYKDVFLKKGIDHTTGLSPLLVLLDGYLFGFLMFDVIRYGMDQDKSVRGVYLLSDFIIAHPIEKLSKLVLLATKTIELQEILKAKFLQSCEFILTTAFTDKPVSMKYRGVYQLQKRVAASAKGPAFLQYTTECGKITCKEAVQTWIKKYSKS